MNKSSPRVLIFEPSLSGHRANYVAFHAKEFLKLGAKVSLAIPHDAMQKPEGAELLSGILDHTEHLPLPDMASSLSPLSSAKAKLSMLREQVRKFRPDHCFVPYADGVSQAWGIKLRPNKVFDPEMAIEGLTMRSSYAYPQLSWKGRGASMASYHAMRRANWTKLHFLDPLGHEYMIQRNADPERYLLIPDIVEPPEAISPAAARQRLNLPAEAHIIACPGGVSTAKGSDTLIDAVLGIQDDNVLLVLFGKHSASLRKKIAKIGSPQRIISIDRFASQNEFNDLFAAADTIAVCYPRHCGSASILLKAVSANKAVVVSDWGWLGWASKNFNLGICCDASDPVSVREAITTTMQNETIYTQRAKRFIRYHEDKNHLTHWTAHYRSRFLPEMKVDVLKFTDISKIESAQNIQDFRS